jgi:membrane-associated protease RseP (regulator of RpoE activity)
MPENKPDNYLLHLFLFVITLITTTLAGAEWMSNSLFLWVENPLLLKDFWRGLHFSIPFLAILTAHEFGHYFTARFYKIKVSLPYYIPLWLTWLGIPSTIGTMGAFIRIKEQLRSNKQFFDVGIAGPLAGFVLALGVLWYGFTHLPPPEHIFMIHPEYAQYGLNYADYVYNDIEQDFRLGSNGIFWFFTNYVAPDPSLVPNSHEMMHYPYLFAGYLALFFTAINLIPIGQLDGGHILFGLIGHRNHSILSPVLFTIFVFYAGVSVVSPIYMDGPLADNSLVTNLLYLAFLYITFSRTAEGFSNRLTLALGVFTAQYITVLLFPAFEGNITWLLFAFIIGRFLGVYHPPAIHDVPLSTGRKILGWLSLLIFLVSFTPTPFIIE